MDKEFLVAVKIFIEKFEEVFDKDWIYTKEMLGVYENENTFNADVDENTICIISPNGTFINPKVEDESEDWGNRGSLLEEYRKLKKFIS